MTTFEQTLTLAGLIPREVIADGRWRRCPTTDKPRKRNGAYKLAIGGGRGWFRNWACDDGIQVWDDDKPRDVRPVDMARIEAARQREREYRIRSMQSARAFWAGCKPLHSLHPYLARKGLSPLGCADLRGHDDLLVAPVWSGEWLVSVQTINAAGDKRFWTGAPVKGGCFVLRRQRSAITCVCEGLATGLAIFQAVKQATVIVAFDAGNLLPVVQRVRPSGAVVICADNDHRTEARIGVNPGLEKARNAAELIGCGVAYPEAIGGSDWADALSEWGNPKRVERAILAQSVYLPEPVT